jgi:hypothetical protein
MTGGGHAMIELTEEQRRALAALPEGPVRCLDPETHRQFVLVRAEWFDLLCGNGDPTALPLEVQAVHYGVDLTLLRGMKAYWRELPLLLRGWWKRGRWVVYHGDTRVGISRSELKLLRLCRKRGIPLPEVYAALIEDRSQPPWEPESMDGTLYEFDELDEAPADIPPAPSPP